MTTDPVYDADQHGAAQDAHTANQMAQERYYTTVITEALTKTIRFSNSQTLCLPYASADRKVKYEPISEVITDSLAYGKPLAALMKVMQESDCPHVQELRKVIAADYVSHHVEWLAEVTA